MKVRWKAVIAGAVSIWAASMLLAGMAHAAGFADLTAQEKIDWVSAHTMTSEDATSFLGVPGLTMIKGGEIRRCDPAPSVACYDSWGGGTWEDLANGQIWPAAPIPWGVEVRWSSTPSVWLEQVAQRASSYGVVEHTPTQVSLFDDNGGRMPVGSSYRATEGWYVRASCDTPLSQLSTQFKYVYQSVSSAALVDCAKRLVLAQFAKLGVTPVEVSVPGAPTGALLSVKGGSATVTWLPPEKDGGSPITGYKASSSDGTVSCSVAPSASVVQSCVAAGVKPGVLYSFTVVASNAAGDGQPSAVTRSAVGTTSPSAPVSPRARVASTTAVVAWKRPASSGGLPILKYVVTASPGSLSCMSVSLSCGISGLEPSTRYRFQVRAVNARGAGAATATKWVVTGTLPVDKPLAPIS